MSEQKKAGRAKGSYLSVLGMTELLSPAKSWTGVDLEDQIIRGEGA